MDFLVSIHKDNLHHAYLIEGDREAIRPELLRYIKEELSHPIQGNPDFSHESYESFTIDDARALREREVMRSFSSGRKVFLIEAGLITIEAQNALLKILEEPTAGTHFFFIIPSRELLVPTVRSRLMIIASAPEHAAKDRYADANEFLSASLPDRLSTAARIAEDKDRRKAASILDGLIVVLREKGGSLQSGSVRAALGQLLSLRGYLGDRSASLKLIVEQAALLLPSEIH
jgi:hypothetical protein